MTTTEFSIQLFCLVDEQMRAVPKHPQAKLWPRQLRLNRILEPDTPLDDRIMHIAQYSL